MKPILTLAFLALLVIQTQSQKLKDDPYVHQCLKFSEQLNSDKSISDLKAYFDARLWTDSMKLKLQECRQALKEDNEKIDYYITRFPRPNLVFYNVNLHHPESKTCYGDFRIVFKDQKDLLIDEWIYLPEIEEEDGFNEDEITPLPLPPAPPRR